MPFCRGCKLEGTNPVVNIKGVSNPDIYIVDDTPDEDDIKAGYPMSGYAGDYLFRLFALYGVADKLRINSLCMCNSSNKDVISRCAYNVVFDILTTNPKIIVGIGKNVASYFLGSDFTTISAVNGMVYDVELNGVSYKFVPIYSPSYVIHHLDGNSSIPEEYARIIYKIINISQGSYVDILETKNIMRAFSPDEFKSILDKYFDKEYTSYDIETNAAPILSEEGKIVGFSFADLDNNGVYVCLESLDKEMSEDDKSKCLSMLREYLSDKSHHLIVHNSMYERPYTLGVLDYEIPFDQLDDTLVMSRLMLGGHVSAGLKYQAQTNLGYPDWDQDLNAYMDSIHQVYEFYPLEKGELKDKDFLSTYYEILGLSSDASYKVPKKFDKYEEGITNLLNVLFKYYKDKSVVANMIKLASDKIYSTYRGKSLPKVLPYSLVPSDMICKYGAVDALATSDLYKYYMDRMDKESTNEVHLHRGYKLWLEHMYAGYIMTRNGAYFDEDIVNQDYKDMTEIATESLRSMLKSPLMKDLIVKLSYDNYLPVILSDYYPDIARSQGYEVIYDRSIDKFRLKYNGKQVAKKNLWEIKISPENQIVINNLVYQFASEKIENAKTFEELKIIYNPGSVTQRYVPEQVLFCEDLNVCKRIKALHDYSNHHEYETDVRSEDDDKLIELANKIVDERSLRSEYGSEYWIHRRKMYYDFATNYRTYHVKSKYIIKALSEVYDNPDFADEGIIDIFNLYQYMGNEPDDRSTYTDRFEWLVNYRYHKKTLKVITSYIEGTVGRQSAMIVDTKEMQSGTNRVLRKRSYYNEEYGDGPKYGESSLVCIPWGVNTASSGRWRCAFQTIPYGSRVKEYYVSRFPGGTIFQPDYSQNEVRALAGSAKCDKMIEAFKSGLDIHRTNAANIWNKPYDEVTTAERRFAKMSCGVGSTKVKLLDGTIRTLEDLYNNGIEGMYAYSYDIKNNKVVPGKIYDIQKTKYVSETCKITFSNGYSEERTLDHRYLLITGEYVEAANLEVGSKIETLYTRVPTKGAYHDRYEQFRDTHYTYNEGYHECHGKWIMTHQMVAEYSGLVVNNGYNIDHIDLNSLNNNPDNLRVVTAGDNVTRNRYKVSSIDGFGHIYRAQVVINYLVSNDLELSKDNYELYRNVAGDRVIHYDTLVSKYNMTLSDVYNYSTYKNQMITDDLKYDPIDYKDLGIQSVSVSKVEIIHHDKPVPVYDISVEKYHNYASYLGDNTSVFSHNTFGILYGMSNKSFADNYLEGDIDKATEIMDGFYKSYPEIAKWIESKHQEVERTGKVGLLTDRFITIDEPNYGSRMRKSQNFPIQGASSDIVGCVIYEICKYIEDNNFKSKLFSFVHDSIEADIYPYELIQLVLEVRKLLVNVPIDQFGIPVKADLSLGKSFGHELELKDIESNDDFTECVMTLSGSKRHFDETIENWKKAYAVVEVLEEEWEDNYVSIRELFLMKKAYSPDVGRNVPVGKAKVHIKYYN